MTPQEVLQHQFPGLTKRDADLALKAIAAAGYTVVPIEPPVGATDHRQYRSMVAVGIAAAQQESSA